MIVFINRLLLTYIFAGGFVFLTGMVLFTYIRPNKIWYRHSENGMISAAIAFGFLFAWNLTLAVWGF